MAIARTLLVFSLSLLVLAAPAQAQQIAFVGSDRATDGEVITRLGDAALHYWRMNGVTGCSGGLLLDAVETPAGFDAEGYGSDCHVSIVEEHIEWVMGYRRPIEGDQRRRAQRWSLRYVCRLVVHEVGHALGLGHDAPFRVMDEYAEPRIPACGRAARELVPNPQRQS